MLILRRN